MQNLQDIGLATYESILEAVTAYHLDWDTLEDLQGYEPEELSTCELEELSELEKLAGDLASEDEALEYIHSMPLSVEVRSNWESLGEELEPSEFNILLCTGGPAVRIIGELDNGTPSRAWLEVQDWGTPWTHIYIEGASSTLLEFAQLIIPY